MKRLILIALIGSIFLIGCDPNGISYKLGSQESIPDSLKQKKEEFIIKVTSAASLHMTGGYYEDPEDLVRQASYEFDVIYAKETPGLYQYVGGNYLRFIPAHELDSVQLKIFNELKNGK